MTREEALKKLADIIFNAAKNGYMPYDTNDELCAMQIAKKHIDDFYTSLPSTLDEEAIKYGHKETILPEDYNDGDIPFYEEWTADAFKAGAEWMTAQGEIVEGYIAGTNEVAAILAIPRKEHNKGDKVVVQIRKKQ